MDGGGDGGLVLEDGVAAEEDKQRRRIRKKNRFIARSNKKVCFLNLARKLRTRQWNDTTTGEVGAEGGRSFAPFGH